MEKNKNILYVDDNRYIREEAGEYLSLLGYNVFEASNGEEALEVYSKNKLDIIITDIEMPMINGLEMVKIIRQNDKKIPILVVTAFMDTKYLLEAIELRLIKYILKPLTNDKLNMALTLALKCSDDNSDKCLIQLSSTSFYDRLNKTLVINNKIIDLTYNEILLFSLLLNYANRVVTYAEIKNKIWNYEENYRDSLRVLVGSLRHKLVDVKIKNVSGVGYRLHLEEV